MMIRIHRRMVRIVIHPDHEDGGFWGEVPSLPGVADSGDTEDEAFANVEASLISAVQSYIEDGLDVPWQKEDRVIREVVIPVDEAPPLNVMTGKTFSP